MYFFNKVSFCLAVLIAISLASPVEKRSAQGTIDIAADDAYELYVDGTLIGSGKNWRQAEQYKINNADQVQVIAVKGNDIHRVVSGIILTFRYDDVTVNTDSQWKCIFDTAETEWNTPGFDDSTWPAAVEFSTNRDDSYVKTNGGNPWWPNIDKAAKMIWTSNNYRDPQIYCRKSVNVRPKTPAPTAAPTPAPTAAPTPAPTVAPTEPPSKTPDCGYIGQLLRDRVDPCKFFQCAYADNDLNLRAVSQPCAPGTSVPSSYRYGNPCVGPELPQCPKGTNNGNEVDCENADLDPRGSCQRVGQFLVDSSSTCHYYQCVYADAYLNLHAQIMSCAPGTSVPTDYRCGNICTGPKVDGC